MDVLTFSLLLFTSAANAAELKINKVETASPLVGDKGTIKVDYTPTVDD